MKDYQVHPAAKIFPSLLPPDLTKLSEDIKAHGLLTPIILHEGLILDGRNRFLACKIAKIEPIFRDWEGTGSPTQWVLSMNLNRRHLTASQKAAIAVEVLPLFESEAKERQKLSKGQGIKGKEKIPDLNRPQARDEAAVALGVNPRYVSNAKKIKEDAPEVFEQIKSGSKTIPQANRDTQPKLAPKPESEVLDKTGWPIPKELVPLWDESMSRSELWLKSISDLRCELRKAQDDKDPVTTELNFNSLLMQLDSSFTDLKRAKPYAVCAMCNGKLSKDCTLCRGRGLISEHYFKTAIPKEMKDRREIIMAAKGAK